VAIGADDTQYRYTSDSAQIYDTFKIRDTTYEIGFRRVGELLGDLNGKVFLDFGSGTGRSAAFLKALGTRQVYAVDHDADMIKVARAKGLDGITFLQAGDDSIPLDDESVDGAISLDVFVEIRTLCTMRKVCFEITRTMRPKAPLIMMSSSPMAFGHTFRSYSYPTTHNLRSGALNPCFINAPAGQFVIEDTYWTEDDYVNTLRQAGLSIVTVDYPRPSIPSDWSTDEASIPPYIVIKSVKE
jgi:ubiquinone/menaquinone biosynthesis C-methylase UbiE